MCAARTCKVTARSSVMRLLRGALLDPGQGLVGRPCEWAPQRVQRPGAHGGLLQPESGRQGTWPCSPGEGREDLTHWWIPQPWGGDSDAGQLRGGTDKKKDECFLLLDAGVVQSASDLCVWVCTCSECACTCLLSERRGPTAFIGVLKGPLIPEQPRNTL